MTDEVALKNFSDGLDKLMGEAAEAGLSAAEIEAVMRDHGQYCPHVCADDYRRDG